LTETLILTTVGLVIAVGHVFTWKIIPALTNERGELRRIPSYTFGVSCILGGVAVWCYADGGDFTWFWRVTALAVAAGLGAVVPRIWEWVAEKQARDQDREDRRGQAN